jgi:hypothetical protein
MREERVYRLHLARALAAVVRRFGPTPARSWAFVLPCHDGSAILFTHNIKGT